MTITLTIPHGSDLTAHADVATIRSPSGQIAASRRRAEVHHTLGCEPPNLARAVADMLLDADGEDRVAFLRSLGEALRGHYNDVSDALLAVHR